MKKRLISLSLSLVLALGHAVPAGAVMGEAGTIAVSGSLSAAVDENGKLKDCVYEIMDAVKRYDASLATGHLSPEESVLLCQEGRKRGVRMILTHPEFPRTFMEAPIQKEMADLGVLIEKNWFNIAQGRVTAAEMAATIRMVGSGHTFLATDRGQANLPSPVSEYKRFIEALLQEGITEAQLRDMTQIVPKSIVD